MKVDCDYLFKTAELEWKRKIRKCIAVKAEKLKAENQKSEEENKEQSEKELEQ